jgi:hypothetical protein
VVQVVQGDSNLVSRDHGVEGEGFGAVVDNEAEFGRVWLRYNAERDGEHAGQQVGAESGRKTSKLDLDISLLTDEGNVRFGFERARGIIPGARAVWVISSRPGPKTRDEPLTD